MGGSPELEAFIRESVRLSNQHGYFPSEFLRMQREHGTVRAIERLMTSAEIQSGFMRLIALGLQDWSLEAAVLKFPDEFSAGVREAAQWRLDQARKGPDDA